MSEQPGRDGAGPEAPHDSRAAHSRRSKGLADTRFWDPVRGAREQLRAQGAVALVQCAGLADMLASLEGVLSYEAEGFVDPRGRPGLHLHVAGRLRLLCQRCLAPLEFALDSRRDIVLVEGANEFEQGEDEDESCDFIPLAARLDLWSLAEEEAILSLPLAPHHEEGLCSPAAVGGGEPPAVEQAPSAFAALAKLKDRGAQ
jgi:uncharacterized protein